MVEANSNLSIVDRRIITAKNKDEVKAKARQIAIEKSFSAFKIASFEYLSPNSCKAQVSFLRLEE
jgi:hypothetical protein